MHHHRRPPTTTPPLHDHFTVTKRPPHRLNTTSPHHHNTTADDESPLHHHCTTITSTHITSTYTDHYTLTPAHTSYQLVLSATHCEQADDKDDEADALLASSPLLRRYVELAKPALEGRDFTAVGAFLFVVSLTCVEQSTLECAAVYVYARALAAAVRVASYRSSYLPPIPPLPYPYRYPYSYLLPPHLPNAACHA